MNNAFRRGLVVLLSAMSLLVLLVSPASANGTTNGVTIGSATRTTVTTNLTYFNTAQSTCQSSKYVSVRAEITVSNVTSSSVYLQKVLLRYYATRPVTLQGRYVINGNGTNVWQQGNYDGVGLTGSFTKTYTINKTVAFSSSRPLYFGINQTGSSFPGEAAWCHGAFTSRFYLKPV